MRLAYRRAAAGFRIDGFEVRIEGFEYCWKRQGRWECITAGPLHSKPDWFNGAFFVVRGDGWRARISVYSDGRVFVEGRLPVEVEELLREIAAAPAA